MFFMEKTLSITFDHFFFFFFFFLLRLNKILEKLREFMIIQTESNKTFHKAQNLFKINFDQIFIYVRIYSKHFNKLWF